MRRLRFTTLAVLLGLVIAASAAWAETLAPAPPDTFSVVVIPDTQAYRGRGTKAEPQSDAPVTNAVLETHVRWILDHRDQQRIVFASHVGDLVDKNVPDQWEVADRWLSLLDGRLPYAISPGNHDMKADGDTSLFARHFPAAKFAGCAWYGGTFPSPVASRSGNNANSFQRFSAQGLDFVFLHLECNAPDDVLQWADQVLRDNAGRRALVTTHMGLGPLKKPVTEADFRTAPKGRMQWKKRHGSLGNTPEEMWQKCFRKHSNLFVIFSGDQSRTQALRQEAKTDAGTPVHEILSDYGPSWLRVCRFVPGKSQIEIHTIDSRDGTLCEGTTRVPQRSEHQFTIPYEMCGAASPRK